MISVKDVAITLQGKGLCDNDRIRELVLEEFGEKIDSDRIRELKRKIDEAVYIESGREIIKGKLMVVVHAVNRKSFNKKKRQINKLKKHFISNGRSEPYRHYAAMFDLSLGAVCSAWKACQHLSSMRDGLYEPDDKMRLINQVWR